MASPDVLGLPAMVVTLPPEILRMTSLPKSQIYISPAELMAMSVGVLK